MGNLSRKVGSWNCSWGGGGVGGEGQGREVGASGGQANGQLSTLFTQQLKGRPCLPQPVSQQPSAPANRQGP